MDKNKTLQDIASTHLGAAGSYAVYSDTFDSTLLVPMPRGLGRQDWNIKGDEFVGADIFHCHEATFLLDNGVPVAGTLKFMYSSNSEFMVESKSMKLYLNSFDMCKMGSTVLEATSAYEKQIQKDLENILKTKVEVRFHGINYRADEQNPTVGYSPIEDIININNIDRIEDYSAQQEHLKITDSDDSLTRTYNLCTNVLRSRCRHTKQKDTGSAYIMIETQGGVLDVESLFKQIISLREVDEFHEFCAEKLYVEIMKHELVTNCSVVLLYSRRGSLDINPIRVSRRGLMNSILTNVNTYTQKTQGQ